MKSQFRAKAEFEPSHLGRVDHAAEPGGDRTPRPPGCPEEQAKDEKARQHLPGRDRLRRCLDGDQNAKNDPQRDDRHDNGRQSPVHVPCVCIVELNEPRRREPWPKENPERKHIQAPVKDAGKNCRCEPRLFVRARKPCADQPIAYEPDSSDTKRVEAGDTNEWPKIHRTSQASRKPPPDAIEGSSQQNFGAECRRDGGREGN